MGAIGTFARARRIAVVEDNAHGLFGSYRDRPLGTFGDLAAQSFHETKNVTCGEGGALFVNRPELVARAEILREKGTDRTRFFRGEVDKYGWVDIGSSYLPSDLLAAFLYAQLLQRDAIKVKRRRIWHRYYDALQPIAAQHNISLPVVPAHAEQAYHMFYILLPSFEARKQLITHLRARGILTAFHYLPLHLSEFALRQNLQSARCPVTERISDCLLRLPFFTSMSDEEVDEVVAGVASCQFTGA
jgi:dTDP-4-amino-4,6-dideoxygalactose transaminase